MKKFALLIIQFTVFCFISITTAGIWWKLWMDHGWVGVPNIVHKILDVDGESSYQATMLEMIIICGLVYFIIFLIFKLFKSES